MLILGYTTTVVMVLLLLFQNMYACMALIFLRKRFSEAKTILQEYIHFYPISTFLVQNIGYTQAKKTVSNITSHKLTEIISSCTVLEVTDDEGEIHLLINIKYTVIVAGTVTPILTMPHFTSLVLCETNVVDYQYKKEASTDQYL